MARVRRSKTDPTAQGRSVALPYGSDPLTCPVRTLRTWLEAAAVEEGPLFRAVDQFDVPEDNALHPDSIAYIVKRATARIGLNVADFAGHSFARWTRDTGGDERGRGAGHHEANRPSLAHYCAEVHSGRVVISGQRRDETGLVKCLSCSSWVEERTGLPIYRATVERMLWQPDVFRVEVRVLFLNEEFR